HARAADVIRRNGPRRLGTRACPGYGNALRPQDRKIEGHNDGRGRFMPPASLSSAIIGPYGLHAVLILALALFAGFVYAFNFTSFFYNARDMTLMFPNQSRSYDATRRAVRFWGHDSAMEWSFFVTEDALKRVQPAMARDEVSMLGAFDAHRERICAAAARLYRQDRKS